VKLSLWSCLYPVILFWSKCYRVIRKSPCNCTKNYWKFKVIQSSSPHTPELAHVTCLSHGCITLKLPSFNEVCRVVTVSEFTMRYIGWCPYKCTGALESLCIWNTLLSNTVSLGNTNVRIVYTSHTKQICRHVSSCSSKKSTDFPGPVELHYSQFSKWAGICRYTISEHLYCCWIPALIGLYYRHLFTIFVTVYPCFAFKKYTNISKFPFRALGTVKYVLIYFPEFEFWCRTSQSTDYCYDGVRLPLQNCRH
jgi:hypothetical protein